MIKQLKKLTSEIDEVSVGKKRVITLAPVDPDEYELSCLIATLDDLDIVYGDIKDLSASVGDVNFSDVPIINKDTDVSQALRDLALEIESSKLTVQKDASQVQLAISENNVLSASIVSESVGTDELMEGAVTCEKIADSSITSEKLTEGCVGTNAIAIEDEEVPGSFYTVSIRNGRLIVRKLS